MVVGGQSIDTVPLAHGLSDEYDILIVHGNPEKDEMEYATFLDTANGLQFKKISALKRSINPLNDIYAFIELYRTIKKFKPAVVHTHGSKPGVTGRLAAWFANVPVIIHTFHGHLFHSYYNRFVSSVIIRLERMLSKISNKIIVLSTEQATEIAEKYKITSHAKIKLIPLGAADELSEQDADLFRTTLRKTYSLSEDDVAIAIIGRMVAVKNHRLFIDIIIAMLPELRDKVKFFLIGDGELKQELQQQLSNANIAYSNRNDNSTASVIFTSWVTPVTSVLHGMDIVVVTSLNEGTPLSLIEAQICRKPVVAADVGGVRDSFIDNASGFLIHKNEVAEYTDKLKLLIENKELRNCMGGKGHIFATEKFSKQEEINAFKKLYTDCLEEVKERDVASKKYNN